jgi:tetratricopeptide (TPR) repeat protein
MADKTTRIKDAQKYLAKGQIDKAIAEWEKIVQEYPDGHNYNSIGDLYLKKGDKRNAIEAFHKAANFFRQEGFSLKALALFKKVLNLNPADADALYALGELSEEKELITDAIKYYLATADSLSKEGKKDRVFEIYEKILSLSPSNIPLRTKVAETFFKQGLKSDAAKEYLFIAGIYENKGDIEKSKEYYRKTIDIQPLNKDAVIGLSCLHEKAGETDKAIVLMKEATVLFHQDVDVLTRAAELSLSGNHIENAKSYLLRINELEPKNAKARRLLGEIYLKEGRKENAWEEYLIVLDDMILQEKYNDAIKILESFKEIDPIETGRRLVSLYKQLGEKPHIAEELTTLGDIYYNRGIRDEALACYNEVYEIAPDNDYLRKQIAELKGEPEGKVPELADITEPVEAEKPEEKEVSAHISIKAEKTVDEIFYEADIFARYGLLGEAQKLLEGLRLKIPKSIDLHLRLKSVYSDFGDKESAVTECLILSEIYKLSGDIENSQSVLREGVGISPSDPRLAGKGFDHLLEAAPSTPEDIEEFVPAAAGEESSIEDYEEELSEADFYARQGLVQEALKILLKLQDLFPGNRNVAERLESLGVEAGFSDTTDMPGTIEEHETSFELAEEESPEALLSGETPWKKEAPEEKIEEREKKGKPEEEPEKTEYEDLSLSDNEVAEAQEMPEPTLDNDVLEIFQEFKKGLEGQLEDEDSETHYNLGIAYKEMGLVDDAIKEFQTSKNDKKSFLQSSSMLAVCYMEKGLYSLAIDILNKTLESIKEPNESYWSLKYDLAEANEKNNNLKEALDLYTEVYGWDARFRNVSEKVSLLKTQAAKTAGKEKPKERKDRVSYL